MLLALARRGGADVAHTGDQQLIAHRRQAVDQVRLDDGAGPAAHHRQVHHQPEGLPVHQVGGGAVVGAGEVFAALDPGGAADPQPAAGGQGLLLLLHAAQQLHLLRVEVAQAAQALQVALGHFVPALAAVGGFAAVGAVEDRIGRRGRGREVGPGTVEDAAGGWAAQGCVAGR